MLQRNTVVFKYIKVSEIKIQGIDRSPKIFNMWLTFIFKIDLGWENDIE